MRAIAFAVGAALGLGATALALQQAEEPSLEEVRAELVRSRGFIRAAETQLSKTLALLDSVMAQVPAPADSVVEVLIRPDFVELKEGESVQLCALQLWASGVVTLDAAQAAIPECQEELARFVTP